MWGGGGSPSCARAHREEARAPRRSHGPTANPRRTPTPRAGHLRSSGLHALTACGVRYLEFGEIRRGSCTNHWRVGNQRGGGSALFNATPLGWAVNLSQKPSGAYFLVPRGRGGRRWCVLLALRVRHRSERPREARAGVNLTTEWPSQRGQWLLSPVTRTAEDLFRIRHVRYLRI